MLWNSRLNLVRFGALAIARARPFSVCRAVTQRRRSGGSGRSGNVSNVQRCRNSLRIRKYQSIRSNPEPVGLGGR